MQCLDISINSDIFNISLDTGLCDTVKCVSTAATDTDYLDLCAYDWLFNILVTHNRTPPKSEFSYFSVFLHINLSNQK
jgi:hypothetical protein